MVHCEDDYSSGSDMVHFDGEAQQGCQRLISSPDTSHHVNILGPHQVVEARGKSGIRK
jgi:hypothetical protein